MTFWNLFPLYFIIYHLVIDYFQNTFDKTVWFFNFIWQSFTLFIIQFNVAKLECEEKLN